MQVSNTHHENYTAEEVMALVDDIEFYGRAVDAGEMDHATAVRQLAQASNGGLNERGAARAIATWTTQRQTRDRLLFDTVDLINILVNGGSRERIREIGRRNARESNRRLREEKD